MKITKKTPLRPRGRSDEKRQSTKDAIREAYANGPQKEVQIIPARRIWRLMRKRKSSVFVPIAVLVPKKITRQAAMSYRCRTTRK